MEFKDLSCEVISDEEIDIGNVSFLHRSQIWASQKDRIMPQIKKSHFEDEN